MQIGTGQQSVLLVYMGQLCNRPQPISIVANSTVLGLLKLYILRQ
jgi:hypothetical protein